MSSTDTHKLAKMLRTLGFLAQTKVYLIWKNLTTKNILKTKPTSAIQPKPATDQHMQTKENLFTVLPKAALIVLANLSYQADILLDNSLLSLFVLYAVNQESQMKRTTLNLVSGQTNRLP